MAPPDTIRLDFVCVHNAGRSQMAAAFAKREADERGLAGVVEVHSGGTNPADSVHEEVAEAMAEVSLDVSGETPRYVSLDELKDSHYLVTMGCSISEFNPAHYGVESRAWDLPNPDGKDMETVREVRDEIERRVEGLFDEIERTAAKESASGSVSDRVTRAVRDIMERFS